MQSYAPASGPYTRVVNGPGWNPSNGTYNPGQVLNAYQLTSNSCVSAASGGPTGTQQSIQDGTCTWKYLSTVDYVSITGWSYDNKTWTNGTSYQFHDIVTSDPPLRAYGLANDSCVSTVAPTGTAGTIPNLPHYDPGTQAFATSDGCQWLYLADVTYTSMRSYIPTQTFTNIGQPSELGTVQLTTSYVAQLWNDRAYIAGVNDELSPIRTSGHEDQMLDTVNWGTGGPPCQDNACSIVVMTAPGESFADNMSPSQPIAGVDPTKGVTLINNNPPAWPLEQSGFLLHDNGTTLIGLQLTAKHGSAIGGISVHGNHETILDCLADGGSV